MWVAEDLGDIIPVDSHSTKRSEGRDEKSMRYIFIHTTSPCWPLSVAAVATDSSGVVQTFPLKSLGVSCRSVSQSILSSRFVSPPTYACDENESFLMRVVQF